MNTLTDRAIIWSNKLALARLIYGSQKHCLTTIVYHHFRFGDETWQTARERLRRQLDFLTSNFSPVDMETALRFVRGESDPVCAPLLVTLDDAKRDTMQVFDLFQSFEVPVTQFVCAGWTARAQESINASNVKLCLVSWLHFYEGPKDAVQVGELSFTLDHLGNAALIDAVIATTEAAHLTELAEREAEMRRKSKGAICDWSELRDLQRQGMAIGCHSVSHPRLAQQSRERQRFEIVASKNLIEEHLGNCPYFAYPYGTPDSHNVDTYKFLTEQGFSAAFTTWPDLTRKGQDRLLMPRIALPDTIMSHATFQARARGGGIPLSRFKHLFS